MSDVLFSVIWIVSGLGLALYLYFFKVRKDIWGP